MTDVQPYLQKIIERIANPGTQAGLNGFTRTLLFKFTDTQEDWVMRIVDGKEAALTKESSESPDVIITTTTEVLAGVLDKKINGITAFMQRKIQTKGAMEDLLKMQKLILV
jgi:putative sterol carrier protein